MKKSERVREGQSDQTDSEMRQFMKKSTQTSRHDAKNIRDIKREKVQKLQDNSRKKNLRFSCNLKLSQPFKHYI